MNRKRILYLDFLRSVSIVGVMFIHFAGKVLGSPDVRQPNWYAALMFNCLGRFAVPVFFMISGSLLLDPGRKCGLKKLFSHNILHIVTALFSWSLLYALVDFASELLTAGSVTGDMVKTFFKAFLLGPTHLWFLYALTGLYLIAPLLRRIAEDKKLMEYFLVLWFLFFLVFNTVGLIEGMSMVGNLLNKLQIKLVYGYSGYFLLGYYLRMYFRPGVWMRRAIYIAGIAGYAFTCIATDLICVKKGYYTEEYLGSNVVNCFFMALAVHEAARGFFQKHECKLKAEAAICKAGEAIFGIYLSHMIVFRVLRKSGFVLLWNQTALGVLVVTAVVYVVCYGLTVLLSRIPVAGKYIV